MAKVSKPYQIADEVYVIPASIAVPGKGLLYQNNLVMLGKEPILVDTGCPIFRKEYLEAAFSVVDPKDVKWVFLSHDDRDHSGNIMQVLEACPNAKLISNMVGIGRMSEEWSFPMNRVYFLNNGEKIELSDRTLFAVRPPYFDSPATRGLYDSKSRVYFSVDTFGAFIPDEADWLGDIKPEVYEHGALLFNRINHPWHEYVDAAKLAPVIEKVRSLQASVIASYHAPPSKGGSEQLCNLIAKISSMEPAKLPSQKDLEAMMAAHRGAA